MADPAPGDPVVNDPILEADLMRTLQIKGRLGALRVLDMVIPTISLGQVRAVDITTLAPLDVIAVQPTFRSVDVFSAGVLVDPPAQTLLADTGPLPPGDYNLRLSLSSNSLNDLTNTFEIQHRNAANTANLAVWHILENRGNAPNLTNLIREFGYVFGLNERLRILNRNVGPLTTAWVCVIFARIQP